MTLKVASMTKLIQAKNPLLIYMMIVWKINNKDTLSDIDQYDNHSPPSDNPDLRKLIY